MVQSVTTDVSPPHPLLTVLEVPRHSRSTPASPPPAGCCRLSGRVMVDRSWCCPGCSPTTAPPVRYVDCSTAPDTRPTGGGWGPTLAPLDGSSAEWMRRWVESPT